MERSLQNDRVINQTEAVKCLGKRMDFDGAAAPISPARSGSTRCDALFTASRAGHDVPRWTGSARRLRMRDRAELKDRQVNDAVRAERAMRGDRSALAPSASVPRHVLLRGHLPAA